MVNHISRQVQNRRKYLLESRPSRMRRAFICIVLRPRADLMSLCLAWKLGEKCESAAPQPRLPLEKPFCHEPPSLLTSTVYTIHTLLNPTNLPSVAVCFPGSASRHSSSSNLIAIPIMPLSAESTVNAFQRMPMLARLEQCATATAA